MPTTEYAFTVDIHDLDDRNPGVFQHGARGRGMLDPGNDDTRGAPGEHFVENGLFPVGTVVRHADDGLQPGVLQLIGNTRQHFRKDEVGKRRDDDADKVHPLRRQGPGDLVWHIAKRPSRLQHLFAGGIRHVAAIAQDPADGHLGNPRGLGYIAQSQRTAGVDGRTAQGVSFQWDFYCLTPNISVAQALRRNYVSVNGSGSDSEPTAAAHSRSVCRLRSRNRA